MKTLIMTMMTLSTTILFLNHPLSLGFNLILLTVTISMMLLFMMKYSWYSYILVLVMLGGMLVLFMYMASIASNEIMKFSMKILIVMIIITITSYSLTLNDMLAQNEIIIETIENQQNMSMMKLFNGKTSIMTIMMAIYLLMTMIYVIYITNTFEGPMRKSK
uniref:NADH-ubiquinone oxidoreductase chain 6 n=1 Tax=Ventidius malayensis TaxID=3095942 RepID=A0AB38Z6C9_9HEMI|nr:NADH dehydrogenase subunit 6 [Ventidius malayensis]WPW46915.1 NADH dehydrogenase subunit 6 [Ventidius malayensis]